MELYIRSQSRRNLMKANDIVARDNQIVVYKENENSTIIGTYATEERALEILDEIQRLINDLQYMSYAVDSSSFYSYRPNVYEMPKE